MRLDKKREKDEVKQTDLGTIFFFVSALCVLNCFRGSTEIFFLMQFFSLTGNLFMPSVPHN